MSTQRPKARRDASNTDAKVLEEEELVWEQVADGKDQTETPLFVAGLRREYTSRKLLKGLRKKTFVAVDNLAFHIEPNQVTCLLGPSAYSLLVPTHNTHAHTHHEHYERTLTA